MNQPLLSVILPVYNGEAYLAQAIESVLAQTYAPSEIIVIDDGSTDHSAAIAARYDGVQVVTQANLGISAARNRGLALAHGDYFALLDADDLWLPRKLEHQMDALGKDPPPDMVFGYAQEFISPELPEDIRQRLHCELEPMPGMLPSALVLARPAFERVGGFGEHLHIGEFADWMLRAYEEGLTQAMVPELVVRRRIHTANNGIRRRAMMTNYARVIKASLDRRRAAGQEPA